MVAIEEIQPFATPQELEIHTKGQIQQTDLRVDGVLAAISRSIRTYCGWHIWPVVESHTLVLDGPGGHTLFLPTGRLTNLRSVTEEGTILDLTATDLDTSMGLAALRKINGWWTDRYGKLVVVIDHGWPEVPDLKQTTLDIAARALASPMGATREQAGSISINWSTVQQGVSGGVTPLNSERETVGMYRLEGP